MKTRKLILPALLCSALSVYALEPSRYWISETPSAATDAFSVYEAGRDESSPRIQVALLLDTSNSMDGLIEQAKSRLWHIINTLTTLKYRGKEPVIEISLYEYGNTGLGEPSDYIRQVLPLTRDLDLLSSKLFSLTTYGGEEYCGQVISNAVSQLKWSDTKADMKLIYIAGNEPFDQGRYSYQEAISEARRDNIYINTIYCGSRDAGISELWYEGARLGKGKYFNIDSDKKVRFIATPYDDRIAECNKRLNETYISYGAEGESKKINQEVQDINASKISASNYAERALTKSKSKHYNNSSWDLVDRAKDDPDYLAHVDNDELPAELKGKSESEIRRYIDKMEKERTAIQNEMSELGKKRQTYIDEQMKNATDEDDLGNAITSSIIELANVKGYRQ
ncbi:MAG: VWA domain-containing protein [Taibaiella sp.]|nr:VWA domain-containing protein [Taibaiella sp.]